MSACEHGGICASTAHGGKSVACLGASDWVENLSVEVGTLSRMSGGAALNFYSDKAHEGTCTGKENSTDPSSVAGGGSATDMVKVTVHGSVELEKDARESHEYICMVSKRSLAVSTSITVVVGSEILNSSATIWADIY